MGTEYTMSELNNISMKVIISKDGPYLVTGDVPLSKEIIDTNENGESVKWKSGEKYPSKKQYALCRCGNSSNKPFCDGSHERTGFDGTESASRQPYLAQAEVIKGPVMTLTDVKSLCAVGRFCDPHGTVWNLVTETENGPSARKNFIRETCDCPSGRLVAWNNESGKPIEPSYEPSIALIEDPAEKCSGPVWLRGGLQLIGADGFEYEVRNRMTLCRCGASQNKPFCDGMHTSIKFSDKN
jgi:CDGSH-type Zn-finger protein